jgi:hypothetical protein
MAAEVVVWTLQTIVTSDQSSRGEPVAECSLASPHSGPTPHSDPLSTRPWPATWAVVGRDRPNELPE